MLSVTRRRPMGNVTITQPSGSVIEHDTSQCCHCGGHFVMKAGSGTQRGFCTRCHEVTCGSATCNPCIPFEEQLRILEK